LLREFDALPGRKIALGGVGWLPRMDSNHE
jgi:hypothetical protein